MRKVLAVLVFLVGLGVAAYLGGWLMFIKPIIDTCVAFDSGTVSAVGIGITVVKCLFASLVASIIIAVSSLIASAIDK